MKTIFSDKVTALVATIFTIVFVQAPHLAWVFKETSHLEGVWGIAHGIAFAIAIDLGVLYFAAAGKIGQTVFFMVVSALVTIYYYYEDIANSVSLGDYPRAFIILVFAVSPALLVFFNSEEFADRVEEQESKEQMDKTDEEIIKLRISGHSYDEIQRTLNINRNRIKPAIDKWTGQK